MDKDMNKDLRQEADVTTNDVAAVNETAKDIEVVEDTPDSNKDTNETEEVVQAQDVDADVAQIDDIWAGDVQKSDDVQTMEVQTMEVQPDNSEEDEMKADAVKVEYTEAEDAAEDSIVADEIAVAAEAVELEEESELLHIVTPDEIKNQEPNGMDEQTVPAGGKNKKSKKDKAEKTSNKAKAVGENKGIVDRINHATSLVSNAKYLKSFNGSIKYKLIFAFLLPVVLIIVLGVLSYTTASKAIISSFETSSQSTIQKTSEYYGLMFSNIKAIATDLSNDHSLQEYYSKSYATDKAEEASVYNSLKAKISSTSLSNKAISNIYIMASYGKGMYTGSSSLTDSEYEAFAATDEAKAYDKSKAAWVSKHQYLDSKGVGAYGVSFIRQVIGTSKKGIGYMFFDLNKDYVTDPISNLNLGDDSIVALIAPDGGEIVTGQKEIDSSKTYFTDKAFYTEASESEEKTGYEYVKYEGKSQLFIYSKTDDGFVICATVPESVITAKAGSIKIITISAVIIAFIVAVIFGGVLATNMSTVIKKVMKALEKASEGDLTVSVEVDRKDEFHILAKSINHMIAKMKGLIEETKGVSGMVDDSARTVTGSAESLLSATREITDSISGIEKGIVQQANDSESCMRQMDVLSEKINVVSDNSGKIAEIAEGTREIVHTGLKTIDELNSNAKDTVEITNAVITGIETMEQSSRSISKIIGVINEIADQTNLLSLNASIEAARAGEAGRGFAVVADEIRKLADQSVASVNQIREIVDEINASTKETVTTARQAETVVAVQEESLKNTMTVFNDIQSQVGELITNLANITIGVEDIAQTKTETIQSIENISAVSQETAAAAEEVTDTAGRQMNSVEDLNTAAQSLNDNANALSEAIGLFKI